MKEARRALGDDGTRQEWIRTVRGRGYRFLPQLDDGATSPGPSDDDLLGRDGELEDLLAALRTPGVVTVVGPGGVGKTALASALARQMNTVSSTDPVVVDLAAIADPQMVVPAIRRAAGITSPTASDQQSVIAIATMDRLVVLDNCEHVIDTVAEVVRSIVEVGGDVRLLCTSRERLGVRTERVHAIAPLPLPVSRALFVSRARRVRPEWEPDTREEEALDALIPLLDGLPLAIEMAAGRVATIGLSDLAAVLADRLDILTSADRRPVERHRTIQDLVAWSCELLTPHEQQLLADFTVFAGPVGLEDAIGVLGSQPHDPDVIAGLSALVDRSLLVVDLRHTPPTYRLLGTTRAVVRGTLAPGDELERCHAEWFAGVAERCDAALRTDDEGWANDRLGGVFAEIRAAHAWARVHDHDLACQLSDALSFYAHSRLQGEPATWSAALLSRLSPDHPGRPLVLADLAADATHRADLAAAATYADQARATATAPLPVRTQVSLLETAADLALYDGDLTESAARNHAMMTLGRDAADRHAESFGIVGQVLAATYADDLMRATSLLDGHVPSPDTSPSARGWLAYARAEITAATAPTDAIVSYERALAAARPVGASFLSSVAEVSLAAALTRAGDTTAALARFARTLPRLRRDGNLSHGVTTLRNLIVLLAHIGADEAAVTLHAALSGDAGSETYGEEEARLRDALRVIRSRRPEGVIEQWDVTARGLGVVWALDHATAVVQTRLATS
ncbi:MAG: hypothetical protein V3S75_07155 [Euzebya tangerina]